MSDIFWWFFFASLFDSTLLVFRIFWSSLFYAGLNPQQWDFKFWQPAFWNFKLTSNSTYERGTVGEKSFLWALIFVGWLRYEVCFYWFWNRVFRNPYTSKYIGGLSFWTSGPVGSCTTSSLSQTRQWFYSFAKGDLRLI